MKETDKMEIEYGNLLKLLAMSIENRDLEKRIEELTKPKLKETNIRKHRYRRNKRRVVEKRISFLRRNKNEEKNNTER